MGISLYYHIKIEVARNDPNGDSGKRHIIKQKLLFESVLFTLISKFFDIQPYTRERIQFKQISVILI